MRYRAWIGRKELEQEILGSDKTSVLLFAADWCGYCKRFLQIVDAYSSKDDATELSVVDAESGDGSLWDEYNVNVVPTLVVYRGGKQLFRKEARPGVGLRETDLEEAIKHAKD